MYFPSGPRSCFATTDLRLAISSSLFFSSSATTTGRLLLSLSPAFSVSTWLPRREMEPGSEKFGWLEACTITDVAVLEGDTAVLEGDTAVCAAAVCAGLGRP